MDELKWFKSSFSAAGACVEIAHLPSGGVALRDSKDPTKEPHYFTPVEWDAFIKGAKAGEFDLPWLSGASGAQGPAAAAPVHAG